MRTLLRTLALAVVVGSLSMGVGAQDTAADARLALPDRHFGEIAYVNGGIGEEEKALVVARAKDFPLKLVFAEKAGPYVADVHVVISSAKGKPVFDMASVGPFLMLKLAPGSYQVQATLGNHSQKKTAQVSAKHQTSLNFLW